VARKLPAFQFYPGDWLKDPAVRAVSPAARGLWMDMLCLMSESSRRGFLQHATGQPVTAPQLARMTGCGTDDVDRLLSELEDAGVFSRTSSGVIFSRRMEKDERERTAARTRKERERGKKSSHGDVTPLSRDLSRDCHAPSSSSSSSSKEEKTEDKEPPHPPAKPGGASRRVRDPKFDPLTLEVPESIRTPEFVEAWGRWVRHRIEIKSPLQRSTAEEQLRTFAVWGLEKSLRMVNHTILMGWRGLREPDVAATPQQRQVPPQSKPTMASRIEDRKRLVLEGMGGAE
jgi:hypothetical protein